MKERIEINSYLLMLLIFIACFCIAFTINSIYLNLNGYELKKPCITQADKPDTPSIKIVGPVRDKEPSTCVYPENFSIMKARDGKYYIVYPAGIIDQSYPFDTPEAAQDVIVKRAKRYMEDYLNFGE